MNDSVFELHDETNELVVLKVNADDPLTVARHPYVSSNMAYITVTKGKDHVLTVILKDGTHGASFDWGEHGHTLISDGLEMLKQKVINFIDDCDICLELTSSIKQACLFYNPNYNSWQLTLNDCAHVWENKQGFLYTGRRAIDPNHGLEWGTDKLQRLMDTIRQVSWKHRIAPTGIDVWDATI